MKTRRENAVSCLIGVLVLGIGFSAFGQPFNPVMMKSYDPAKASQQAWDMRVAANTPQAVQQTAGVMGTWECVGMTGVGRFWDVEVDPTKDSIVYAAAGTGGGVVKTIDQGKSWRWISGGLNGFKSQSIGDIAIDPNDHNVIWVGGGEGIAGGGSMPMPGVGIYKSTNGGETWTHKGLPNSYFISRIAINPTNSNLILVGVMGTLWSTNPDRGIYRTTDGGTTWTKITAMTPNTFLNDSTGCTEVLWQSPTRAFATFWTCIRYPYDRRYNGNACRVYVTNDAGVTWTMLGAAQGLPESDLGRTQMTMCATNKSVLYLSYLTAASTYKGLYKSTDSGKTWAKTSGQITADMMSYYGFAFDQIFCSPWDANDVTFFGVYAYRSTDGGASWEQIFGGKYPWTHVDFHGLSWSRQRANLAFVAHDGGVDKFSAGLTGAFTSMGRGPLVRNGFGAGGFCVVQPYSLDVARDNANYRYQGVQDNGTNYTTTGRDDAASWTQGFGGDGFQVRVDPGNCNYVIGNYQDGHYYRSSNRTTFSPITPPTGRNQWRSPIAFDSVNGNAYIASQYVFRAPRGSGSFTQISSDLTNGDHTWFAHYFLGCVIALEAHNNVVYAGSDDGNIWVSTNANAASPTWTKIKDGLNPAGTNERSKYDGWIYHISIDHSVANGSVAYVAIWYHRWGKQYWKPSIYKLTNWGLKGAPKFGSAATDDWKEINGDLPADMNTMMVIKDNAPARNGWLYCATDWGVYASTNGGVNWGWLGDTTLPLINITDLCLHNSSQYLYVSAYGRGINRINLATVTAAKNTGNAVYKGIQTLSAFPNPVRNKTTINFNIRDRQIVTVAIYDLHGRLIKTLLDNRQVMAQTTERVTWDRTTNGGARVATGNYICRLIGEKVTLAKLITVK